MPSGLSAASELHLYVRAMHSPWCPTVLTAITIRAHARRTSLKGDFITLAGHFSEYLTTDQIPYGG